jgi:5-methylthioadenosine/S-adenosylhomocysteine deaminase
MTPGAAVDLAVVDATVVTMDPAGTVHRGAAVLVDRGTIAHVGPLAEPVAARHTIDARGAIVVPGLVNAHTHLAMTLFRGLADDLDLDRFLARLLPAEATVLSEATVAAGTTLAVAECFRSGITTALDMYFFPAASKAVADAAGFDLRHGPVFVELSGPDELPFAARLKWAGDVLAATDPARRWVCPHSTYLLDADQLAAVGALAAVHGARVHVHACETAAELDLVRDRHRRSPIEVLRDTGLLGPGTVLGHAVHLTDADIELVAASGASVTHCPASNQKLASGFARIPELLAAGVPVALGTDGAASANDLDLWLAMRLAAYPLAARVGVGTVGAGDVLAMATRGGGHAVGAPEIGTIEVGTRADLVVLDPSSPALTPAYDPVSTVAYAASRADVRWVVAGGQLVVDDRRLTTLDVDAAIAAVRDVGPTIAAATGAVR